MSISMITLSFCASSHYTCISCVGGHDPGAKHGTPECLLDRRRATPAGRWSSYVRYLYPLYPSSPAYVLPPNLLDKIPRIIYRLLMYDNPFWIFMAWVSALCALGMVFALVFVPSSLYARIFFASMIPLFVFLSWRYFVMAKEPI